MFTRNFSQYGGGIGRRKKEGGKNGGIRQGVDWVRLVKCFANFFPLLDGKLLGNLVSKIYRECFAKLDRIGTFMRND